MLRVTPNHDLQYSLENFNKGGKFPILTYTFLRDDAVKDNRFMIICYEKVHISHVSALIPYAQTELNMQIMPISISISTIFSYHPNYIACLVEEKKI